MSSRMVVALSGWKQSGKDTTAEYLVQQYGFQQLSFAAKLKDLVAETYKVPREFMDSPIYKEQPITSLPVISSDRFSEAIHLMLSSELKSGFWTPRALCILEGSIKRSVYSNFWVRECTKVILDNPDKSYVVSDMRYCSEADTLRMLVPDIHTVRIERFDSIETQDPSERDLDTYGFQHRISNKGDRNELYKQVDTLVLDHLDPF